jgi:cation diffusion facilitator family transporter
MYRSIHTEDEKDAADMNSTSQRSLESSMESNTPRSSQKVTRFIMAIVFCLLLFLVQLIGAHWSGSLALYADAFHLLSDVLGYFVSLISIFAARRNANSQFTFGFQRWEWMGALGSIAIVWVLSVGLMVESYERMIHPSELEPRVMLVTSFIAIVTNSALILIFYDHHRPVGEKDDLNIKAALLHCLGDILCSVSVLISAVILQYFPDMVIIDPILTLLFSLVAIFTTWPTTRDITTMLTQGILIDIKPMILKLQQSGVEVQDLKVWHLSRDELMGTCVLCHGSLAQLKSICMEYNIDMIVEISQVYTKSRIVHCESDSETCNTDM